MSTMTLARRMSWKIAAVAMLLLLSHSSAQSMVRTSVAQREPGGEQEGVPNSYFPRADVERQQRQFRTAGAAGSPTSPAFGRAALSVTSANALIWAFSRTLRSEEASCAARDDSVNGFAGGRENNSPASALIRRG